MTRNKGTVGNVIAYPKTTAPLHLTLAFPRSTLGVESRLAYFKVIPALQRQSNIFLAKHYIICYIAFAFLIN